MDNINLDVDNKYIEVKQWNPSIIRHSVESIKSMHLSTVCDMSENSFRVERWAFET